MLVISMLSESDCFAENDTSDVTVNYSQDSIVFQDFNEMARPDTVIPTGFQMQKSPTGAIWRSLVLPGWGQYYVESYWKAPIFTGAAAFMIYRIVYFHNNFMDYADRVDVLKNELDRLKQEDPENPQIYEIEYRTLPVEKNRREYYRDNRDMSGFYLLGIYALATVDAYVGAHLFDFDVSDEGIAYYLQPGLLFNSINLHVSISFSLEEIFP
jgi:hypothetical protein